MNQLVNIVPITSDMMSQADQEMAQTLAYKAGAKAASTVRSYISDWQIFCAWCNARGLCSLPAEPGTVARFLSFQAASGKKSSTIGRRSAAIGHFHREAGFEPPANVEAVKATIAGIRRAIGTAPNRKMATTSNLMMEMLSHCDQSLRGLRDRALLALAFAGAMRRSEVVALRVEDLAPVPDGYLCTFVKSKGDQEGAGQTIGILRGVKISPVAAVDAWLAAANITTGLIFREIKKGGRIQETGLSGHSAAAIVKRYAKAAGIDPALVGGHSLRAGYLTSAAENGANVLRMIEVSRHKSIDMLTSYVRRANIFKDHSGAGFL